MKERDNSSCSQPTEMVKSNCMAGTENQPLRIAAVKAFTVTFSSSTGSLENIDLVWPLVLRMYVKNFSAYKI